MSLFVLFPLKLTLCWKEQFGNGREHKLSPMKNLFYKLPLESPGPGSMTQNIFKMCWWPSVKKFSNKGMQHLPQECSLYRAHCHNWVYLSKKWPRTGENAKSKHIWLEWQRLALCLQGARHILKRTSLESKLLIYIFLNKADYQLCQISQRCMFLRAGCVHREVSVNTCVYLEMKYFFHSRSCKWYL